MASNNPRRRGTLGWTGIGLGLAAGLLWWSLHDVAFGDVLRHLATVRPVVLGVAIVAATLTFPLRTVRWRYLFDTAGARPGLHPLWHATAIGFMANNLLPARTGEIARAYAARRLTAVSFPTAVGTLVVERILDGLTMVGVLAIGLFAGGFAPGTTVLGFDLGGLLTAMGALFAIALGAAAVAVRAPHRLLTVIDVLATKILPSRWVAPAQRAVRHGLDGLSVLRDARRLGPVLAWSVVLWTVGAVSFWLGMLAFGIDIPWSAGFLLQALIAFGVAVPAAPGYFGVFEAVTKATLGIYGVSATVAVSYAIGFHLFTFLPITLLGLWSLSRAHLHLADLRATPTTPPASATTP